MPLLCDLNDERQFVFRANVETMKFKVTPFCHLSALSYLLFNEAED